MAVCPACQSEIEIASQHYGTLFTCPSCNGVFFVDWGGQPEAATSDATTGNTAIFSEPLESVENSETAEGPYALEIPDIVSGEDFEPSTQVRAEEPEPAMAEEAHFDYGDFSPQAHSSESSTSDTPDLSEVADFGNADLTQTAFNYTLTISGIDSSNLRLQVEEALSDSKFGLNVTQLMSQIKDGVLTIKSMNPVKASILMQRVKYLPVKVSWRQDVLSSSV